jgi:hypothetical protein
MQTTVAVRVFMCSHPAIAELQTETLRHARSRPRSPTRQPECLPNLSVMPIKKLICSLDGFSVATGFTEDGPSTW